MKILYLCSQFPLVSETFIAYEIYDLLARGCDVRILSLSPPPDDNLSSLPDKLGYGDRIYLHPPLKEKGFGQTMRTIRLLMIHVMRGNWGALAKLMQDTATREHYPRYTLLETACAIENNSWKPDIVHCHFGPHGRFASILKHYGLISGYVTTTFHGYGISRHLKNRPKTYYDTLFEQGALFLAVNEKYLSDIRRLGASENKSKVFHIGVDCSKFAFHPRTMPKDDTLRFICVGRLTEKKGHIYTIQAFAKLRDQKPDQDMHLDLIGDGPLFETLKDLVRALKLENHVTLHGALQHEDVSAYLRQAHIFVLHSVTAEDGDMEGIPVALMEAMAQGLPVISTRHSGIPELIEEGISGLLCDERDVDRLCGLILDLIDRPEQWDGMTQQARRTVEEKFSRQTQADALYASFESLLP